MNIGTVVEGPSDRLVLEAILDRLCPGEHRYFPLQPIETLGTPDDPGWKGVQRWCLQTWQRAGSSLEKILSRDSGPPLDLLVIQIDADIANKIDLQQPCPPVRLTTDKLRQLIQEDWLKKDQLPPQIIFAIPSQDTETWTFAALFPDDDLCKQTDYECPKKKNEHPGYRLTLKRYDGWLRRAKNKKGNQTIKKPTQKYRKLAPLVAANWEIVCHTCSQARRFDLEIKGLTTTLE